ncbi:glutamate-rich protein 2 isoform X3 [Chelonoidis abingdonii]|uniref:glutamate-rich protein 2 isoform X3 n=1 Tax=Chelonoidis abingdonii TaxID=106734 RepID=UPI003F49541A
MNRCEVGWGPGTPRTTTPKVSGMLEVVGPDGTCYKWIYSRSLLDNVKAELFRNNRCHKGPKEWTKWQITCVWAKRQHGCGPESTNKVYTPTKQISLCAAKSTFEKYWPVRSTLTEEDGFMVTGRKCWAGNLAKMSITWPCVPHHKLMTASLGWELARFGGMHIRGTKILI